MSVPHDRKTTDLTSPEPGLLSQRGAGVCRATGFFLAAGGALFHALTTLTPLPGWELDPLVVPVPHTGIGPGGSMLTDIVIGIGVVLIMIGEWARGGRISFWALILYAMGACGVLLSGVGQGRELFIVKSWTAAMTLGVAMFHLCRDDRYKRMVLAVLAGFIIILAVRGAQQVFIEHPETMQEYRQNRERFLDAQGWTHDSSMAKSYERRIMQNDATGWFGLSNVYATFAAGGATAGTVLVAASLLARRRHRREQLALRRESPPPRSWWQFSIPVAGVTALVLADAKGGLAAYLLGLGFAGLAGLLCSRPSRLVDRLGRVRIGAILSLGAIAATVSLVVIRGLLGTRFGELSLLFRWFYLEAAARIGLHNFPLGCGADGFKAMYMQFKNPLSPENVSSSHNLLADFWACGGALGIAWISLWLWWIARAGAEASKACTCPSEPSGASRRGERTDASNVEPGGTLPPEGLRPSPQIEVDQAVLDFRLVAGIGIVATFLALRLETPVMTPDLALARVVGLIAWCGIAWLMISRHAGTDDVLNARAVRFTLSAAAVAMGAHALIDQTGVWPSSAPLLMLFIGAAAAGSPSFGRLRSRLSVALIALFFIANLGSPSQVAQWKVFQWERLMIRAAEAAHPAAEVSIALQNLSSPRAISRSQAIAQQQELIAHLRQLTGHAVKDSSDAVHAAVEEVVRGRIHKAIELMTRAQAIRPHHMKTQRELSRLELALGQRLWIAGDKQNGKTQLDRALAVAIHGLDPGSTAASSRHEEASSFSWAAVVYQTRFELTGDLEELRGAIPFLEQGSKLDPYGLENPKRLMKLHVTLGNTAEATRWARKSLEIDELQRLDKEVQGLRESERAEALRLTGNP